MKAKQTGSVCKNELFQLSFLQKSCVGGVANQLKGIDCSQLLRSFGYPQNSVVRRSRGLQWLKVEKAGMGEKWAVLVGQQLMLMMCREGK